jgi:hypothetical protein
MDSLSRFLWFLRCAAGTLITLHAAAALADTCCECKCTDNRIYKGTPAPTVTPGTKPMMRLESCDAVCKRSCPLTQSFIPPARTIDGSCVPPSVSVTTPEQVLIANIRHAVGHEGASVWTGPTNSDFLPPPELRQMLVKHTDAAKDSAAIRRINLAPAATLLDATRHAIAQCRGDFDKDIAKDFDFAYTKKGRGPAIWHDFRNGGYTYIRVLFEGVQRGEGDRRKQYALFCYSGEAIRDLVKAYPEIASPPATVAPQQRQRQPARVTGDGAGIRH